MEAEKTYVMNHSMEEPDLFNIPDKREHISSLHAEIERLLEKGIEAFTKGKILSALNCFEKALKLEERPIINSYFALCIAKERGEVNKAISLCAEAIRKEPNNPIHYLNLGRIYLLSNKKVNAITIFREGLKYEENQQIVDEMKRLGTRNPHVLSFLKRSNSINKYLGIMLKKLRLR